MKKLLLLSTVVLLGCAANANPGIMPFATEMHSLQGQTVHDMNYIRQQEFKHREYNEMKDLQQQKDKKNKEIEIQEPAMKKIFYKTPAPQTQNLEFTEENGEIKIESTNK